MNTYQYQNIDSNEKIDIKHVNFESEVLLNKTIVNSNDNIDINNNQKKKKSLWKIITFIIFTIASILIFYNFDSLYKDNISPFNIDGDSSFFDKNNRYIIREFDNQKPNSNFLSGIGGLWGIPMWVFYVNRGQGITSFGVQNKDGPISKFKTAEKAWQETSFTGFRTFIKGKRYLKKKLVNKFTSMPFFPVDDDKRINLERNMMVGINDMEINEIDHDNNIQTNILYYSLVNEDFPALIRKTTFTNLDSKTTLDIDVLDGLAKLVPFGLSNGALDSMGRTMEAWMNVYNVNEDQTITQPFFHISQGTADTAEVQIIKKGHFVLSFIDNEKHVTDGLHDLLPFIVDPNVIFDHDTTLSNPKGFYSSKLDMSEFIKQNQGTSARTPCAFSGSKLVLKPNASISIITVYGHSNSIEEFINIHAMKIKIPGYITNNNEQAKEIIAEITNKVKTKTSSKLFDSYVKQNFLDNVLRGGIPLVLGDSINPKIYHVYSRIHGDIERDYNNFQVDNTFFSQGPGNFRDVNQNRRFDVFHTPLINDFNIRMFLSFVQIDGYNPLTVATTNFKISNDKIDSLIVQLQIIEDDKTKMTSSLKLKDILLKSFRIGQFYLELNNQNIKSSLSRDKILDLIMKTSIQVSAAQYAQNGFWADHWTYTLDLIDNYITIYPDKEALMLWDSEPIPFYMSPAIVKSRKDRYSLAENPNKPGHAIIKVIKAVSAINEPDYPQERIDAMNKIYSNPYYVADIYGAGGVWQQSKEGEIVKVSIISKLILLGVIKFSTLDPYGLAIEFEGGKPSWNDAMNGLPSFIGAGMPETYEMLRILNYCYKVLKKYNKDVSFPIEFDIFINSINNEIDNFNNSPKDISSEFLFWNASNNAREYYRSSLIAYFNGEYKTISSNKLQIILNKMIIKTENGIERALIINKGISPTYFWYESTDFDLIQLKNNNIIKSQVESKGFEIRELPLFLEGPTRHLKVINDIEKKRQLYKLVKNSPCYDKKLKMYRLSGPLTGVSQEMGRMMAFPPGWLENQSIWLHMSYKFYLELLRGGLYDEFYLEIKTGLVPFMNNTIYGRSPIEAASFIVSSAFPDVKMHGTSFLPRLSGSTAEFLSMWAIIMAGVNPFVINEDGKLNLSFKPIIAGFLFTDEGLVTFQFLSKIKVIYHNPKKQNTWLLSIDKAIVTFNSGVKTTHKDGIIDENTSYMIRNSNECATIDVYY